MDGAEARRILDEYFPRKKRFVGVNYSTKQFNIIGFGTENVIEYKHCPLDPGVRLIKIKNELRCPTCGYTYRKEEAVNEQVIEPQHAKQQTRIITAKSKKKKRYADNGEEIKDPDLYNEHVTYYHEELPK
jgi:DNA-directed RNA polymerase subunit M/transcription elongation factor TFIIS